jgi:hypothetical protein
LDPGLSPKFGGILTRLPGLGGFSASKVVVDDPIFAYPKVWLSQGRSMTQQENSSDYEPDYLEKHRSSLLATILQKWGFFDNRQKNTRVPFEVNKYALSGQAKIGSRSWVPD